MQAGRQHRFDTIVLSSEDTRGGFTTQGPSACLHFGVPDYKYCLNRRTRLKRPDQTTLDERHVTQGGVRGRMGE